MLELLRIETKKEREKEEVEAAAEKEKQNWKKSNTLLLKMKYNLVHKQ